MPLGPCRSMVVTMRKLCALPSKPSGRPRRSRATRSSTCSPRCPNGGWPRSWASAAASTTSGSQPPSSATDGSQAQPLGDRPRDLRHLQAVRQPVVHQQAHPGRADHLRDAREPGEERRRGDPVAVDAERAGREAHPVLGDPRPPRRPCLVVHAGQAIPTPKRPLMIGRRAVSRRDSPFGAGPAYWRA